jgi:hypothetical protein
VTRPAEGARRRLDRYLSYVVLILLVLAWLVLFTTLPRAADRQLTLDITCRSGNPVVGVWVESATGGSSWAQRGEASRSRFIFKQPFKGDYQVRAGCGGNAGQWGVEARSAHSDVTYRRLLCDDVEFTPPQPASCRDELGG